MKLNKKVLAGLVAFAAANSAQAVTVMAEDGWTLGVSGQVNQFAVFTDDKAADADIAEVRDGLLPAFINFDMKAPTMNGLDLAAHISFSPSTNTTAQEGGNFEQREVYFTVDGSFGQVLAGKALGLYGSHNILNEQTLFGVGWGVGGNGTTTLGGIGLGYDYADWRSQIRWTSNDMNGFKVAFAVVDPVNPGVITQAGATGPLSVLLNNALGGQLDDESLRYEADLSYAGAFDGGSFKVWTSGAWQDHDAITNAEDASYWTVGGTLAVAGFEFMAQYSDAEDVVGDGTANSIYGGGLVNAEWDQYVIQAGYRFAGTTLVSANYSELETDVDGFNESDDTAERITLGVYHDVNSNLKLVAEYTQVEHDDENRLDQEIISFGGFVFF
jgi:predicted porin